VRDILKLAALADVKYNIYFECDGSVQLGYKRIVVRNLARQAVSTIEPWLTVMAKPCSL